MAERLNNIAYQQNPGSGHQPSPSFNPRSVSLDIRTPEELAAVNEFLLTLGRDVSGAGRPASSHNSFPDNYFDAANLSQLGLSGMPGLPSSNTSFPDSYNSNGPPYTSNNSSYHSSRSSHPPVQGSYGSMYMNDPPINYSPPSDYVSNSARRSSKYASGSGAFSSQHYHHPTPPLESSSPHSTVSTPINTTPPQVPMSMPDTFDYLRAPRGAPTVAHLAPPEYLSKSMRPMIPLKSVPSALAEQPQPIEPKLPLSLHRHSTSNTPLSKPGSLYPLLTSGDIQYKLPPLNRVYRSPSPPSRESSPSSTHSSPGVQAASLPSIHSIVVSPDSEEHHLSKGLDRIELERSNEMPHDERKRHAKLILDLLVSINSDFKSRYSSDSQDVEMAAA